MTHLNRGFPGRLRTTYHRQSNKRVAKRLKTAFEPGTRVLTFDTAKHFIIPIEILFL